jgi:hypothetical protein
MGVPYGLVVDAYVLAALGLLSAWLGASSLAGRLPKELSARIEPDRRARWVQRRVLAFAAALVALPLVLIALGAPLRPDQQPLTLGDQWGGYDPALLQIIDVGGRSQFTYAFQPGGEIRMGITLANNGGVPLTVMGVGPPPHPIYVRGYKFLVPPGGPAVGPITVYPGIDPTWTSEAFKPFEIPAHSEVALGLAVDLTTCPDLKPVPTLAPGASLIPNDDSFTYVSGFGAADVIQVNYAAFGISRTAAVELQGYMNVATGNASSDAPPNCPEL